VTLLFAVHMVVAGLRLLLAGEVVEPVDLFLAVVKYVENSQS
jgi:hypothetical protein